MSDKDFILMILVCAAATFLLRALPFIAFSKRTPDFITYLGRVLPCAVMAMLTVYCLKDAELFNAPYALPEVISCLVVIVLHVWKRNVLLSIIAGTVCYMLIVQNFI